MNGVDVNGLYNAFIIFLALCGAVATIGKAVDTIKAWKKPHKDADDAFSAALKRHGDQLDRDKRRLDNHDMELDDIRDGQRALCAGVKALLEHALHNGNSDEMKEASAGIDKWLISRH